MADTKISELTELAEAPNDADVLAIVDTSATATKKITAANLKSGLQATLTKGAGTDINTGTDDAKYITAKALADQTVLLKKAGGTLTGEVDLGENAGLVLDAALSADGKYSGITVAGTAGATLAFGDLCYLNGDDSRWELVDANVADGYDKTLGICVLAAANDGDATKMLLWGKVRADTAFPTLAIGAPAYISETAGDIVTTAPTTADVAVRVVGTGLTADELLFTPSPDYYTHT